MENKVPPRGISNYDVPLVEDIVLGNQSKNREAFFCLKLLKSKTVLKILFLQLLFQTPKLTLKKVFFYVKWNYRKGLWTYCSSNFVSKHLFWAFWAAENGPNLPKLFLLSQECKFNVLNIVYYVKSDFRHSLWSAFFSNFASKYPFWPFYATKTAQIRPNSNSWLQSDNLRCSRRFSM